MMKVRIKSVFKDPLDVKDLIRELFPSVSRMGHVLPPHRISCEATPSPKEREPERRIRPSTHASTDFRVTFHPFLIPDLQDSLDRSQKLGVHASSVSPVIHKALEVNSIPRSVIIQDWAAILAALRLDFQFSLHVARGSVGSLHIDRRNVVWRDRSCWATACKGLTAAESQRHLLVTNDPKS